MKDLYELETSLFKGEYLKDKDYLEHIFHEGFMEYGKSGLVYYKRDTIDSLYGLDDRNIEVSDFSYLKIDNNTYIVHYVSKNSDGIEAYRTSIWLDDEVDGMQLYFHQGTIKR